jgi:methionyl-tRNA synthetase
LHERYERELANDLGNLLSRTTAMIARYRHGRIPDAAWDSPVRAALDGLRDGAAARLDRFDLTGALDDAWSVVRDLNRYVEENAPWRLAKEEARAGELDRTLYDLAEGLRGLAVALAPYLPDTAPRILGALRQPCALGWERVGYGWLDPVDGVEPAPPLFPRVESPVAAE